MKIEPQPFEPERYEFVEPPRYRFSVSRRAFVQSVGAGLLISGFVDFSAFGQQRGGDDETPAIGGRFHIGKDGRITAFTGKVEVGQGARTQLTQAAAEELCVPIAQIDLVMADTGLVPNDGGTYGSLTTSRTVPAMRQAAVATRELLIELACKAWAVSTDGASMRDGVIEHANGKKMTLAELAAGAENIAGTLQDRSAEGGALTAVEAWQTLGKTVAPVNGPSVVTGKHRYTSDIRREGMLYGKVLRPPAYGAELTDVDMKAAEAMDGVVVVRDGAFVGCAAPTSYLAQQALNALASTAKWTTKPHPASDELFAYLKSNTREGTGRQRSREEASGDVDAALAASKNVVRAEYHIPYIQHAPMEPRAAVAEFDGNKLTVWT
ncbi:MAG TPA: molybdopterin-dependent oxidoreductase, partial [Candidatus Hydrogenedentes bacterium]|nr:molybdopterin-dependent oxidoreductase [Candidatus Hydrogenedentota bacterium]